MTLSGMQDANANAPNIIPIDLFFNSIIVYEVLEHVYCTLIVAGMLAIKHKTIHNSNQYLP